MGAASSKSSQRQPFFREHAGEVRLVWPEAEEDQAFRAAQLGALMALAGHLQTSREPAQGVLPTGVGKTAVITALPFLVPCSRVLVVVPTRLLRDQIHDEFADLATLRRIGAVSAEANPKVVRVSHRLSNRGDWDALAEADVVIGTPGVLSANYEQVADPPQGLFDLLVFDEAHHLPATTWTGILRQHDQPAALLTATPFRRDRKALPGTLVYNYPLRRAIEDGVYAPIDFIPVDSHQGDDVAIAEKALERLEEPVHQREGTLLIVRSDRIDHADELVNVYERVGIKLGLITSRHSSRHMRAVLSRLRAGELQGVASVGALVEGFDMPKLKIAAYHRPHRTLPPTLQFVGRIARVTGGEAHAELVAIRDDFTRETRALYQEDTAWTKLLPELVDAVIERERVRRVYINEAEVESADISPDALTPRRITQVFAVPEGADLDLRARLDLVGFGHVVFRFIDADGVLLAAITERRVRPDWIDSDVLDTNEYHLHLAVHDEAHSLLYISAPSETAVRQLRDAIGAEEAKQIPPERVARYLWTKEVTTYSSVGMRNARAAGARQASYRSLAGPAVEGAVSENDARGYALGHVIGRHGAGNELHGMGVSLKRAKIWETALSESLFDFRAWCVGLSDALVEAGEAHATAPHLQLRLPAELREFPDSPIAAFLHYRLIRGGVELVVGDEGVDLIAVDPMPRRVDGAALELDLVLDEEILWSGRVAVNGKVELLAGERQVRWAATHEEMTVSEILLEFPPVIFFADGSSSEGATLYVPPEQLAPIPSTTLAVWPWGGVDIENEQTPTDPGAPINVQAHARQWAEANLDNPILIADHAAYELADLIGVERDGELVRVHLFHCKRSGEHAPGRRLSDLEDVLAQAVRSARWTHALALFGEIDRRLRTRPTIEVVRDGAADVHQLVADWAERGAELALTVWVVQPGISRAATDGWHEGSALITAAREWCQDQGAALQLAISP